MLQYPFEDDTYVVESTRGFHLRAATYLERLNQNASCSSGYVFPGRWLLSTCAVPIFRDAVDAFISVTNAIDVSWVQQVSQNLSTDISPSEHWRSWLLAKLHLSIHTRDLIDGTVIKVIARLPVLEDLHIESCLRFRMITFITYSFPNLLSLTLWADAAVGEVNDLRSII
jgi:hypothetical protein